jgi:hypothetical protein
MRFKMKCFSTKHPQQDKKHIRMTIRGWKHCGDAEKSMIIMRRQILEKQSLAGG